MDQTESLQALLQATLAVNQSVDLSDVLLSIANVARDLLGAERVTLYVVDHEKGELWSTVLEDPSLREIRLPLGRGVAGSVARDGEPVLLNNPYSDPRFEDRIDRESGFRTRNMLVAPLKDPTTGAVLGVLQLLNKIGDDFSTTDTEKIAEVSAHVAVTLRKSLELHNLQIRQAELQKKLEQQTEELIRAHGEIRTKNEAMRKELEMAVLLQRTLLPDQLPQTNRIWFETFYRPSTQLSGDLYELMRFDDHRLALVMVDVMGHGVASAMVGAMFKMAFHFYVSPDLSPAHLAGRMNQWLADSLPAENRMMTAVYLYLDCQRLSALFTVAGHPHPRLLRRTTGQLELIDTGDIPLGTIPDFEFHEKKVQLEKGDRVLLFTDGLYESEDADGRPMGMQTADAIIRRTAHEPIQVLIEKLWSASCAHRGVQPSQDDVTLVGFDVGPIADAKESD